MADHNDNLSETDLELLETYLDGELSIAESEGLWRRLQADAALKAALDDLRAQQSFRVAVWEAMEPNEASVAVVCHSVAAAVRRRRTRQWASRALAYVGAAAACLLVGVRIGSVWHPAEIAATPATPAQYQVAIRDSGGNVIDTARFQTQQQAADFVDDLSHAQLQEGREPGSNVAPASYEQY